MSIKSGRYTKAGTIITGRTGVYYRILNSGDFVANAPDTNAIRVTFGNGANDQIFLRPTFSADILVSSDVTVAGTGTIQGMYEALPNPEFRNGRFKTRSTMVASDGVKIVVPGGGNSGAVYRIFNTGANPFTVYTANANGGGEAELVENIEEDQSRDFVTPGNKLIIVKPDTATDYIEGIYELIREV